MRIKTVSEEVLYPDERVVVVDGGDVEMLKRAAAGTRRLRTRLCTHPDAGDRLHEMLIVHTRDIYVRPHRQRRGKSESLHMIEGELDVVLFDDTGAIMSLMAMGEFRSGKPFYYRVGESFYHTVLIRSEVAIFHEITNGPFAPGDTEFAPWAAEESDAVALAPFRTTLEELVRQWKNGQRS
jgi:cupin fold WbuC family metalloprotein